MPWYVLVCRRRSAEQRTAKHPGLFTPLPVVDVTTTGRRSGLRRTSHLIPIPTSDTLALLGTNFP